MKTLIVFVLVLGACIIVFKRSEQDIDTLAFKMTPMINNNGLPGADVFSKKLLLAIDAKQRERGEAYKPRTKHLDSTGRALFHNRLFLESSPYLVQHAHNPVNWFPWGEEALDLAKTLDRPIFLSVGYSTCHWCHVMEEESFEDLEIAKMLNEKFVAIKVDREERPDIDAVYMAAVQAMTGSGGWPMSVFLTPNLQPFFGGTYFPARSGDRGRSIGFLNILAQIDHSFKNEREQVVNQGLEISNHIAKRLHEQQESEDLPGIHVLKMAASTYKKIYDQEHGGVDRAPKFPSSMPVKFLLRYYRRTNDQDALEMARTSLEKMAEGGIHDQVAGGFHRYSTDKHWLVPHFEKMLYDNALLAQAYLEGYQVTKQEKFLRVVESTLRFVEREMTSPEGAFYSAIDADSIGPAGHREEGYFYTWTPDELKQTLGEVDANIASQFFGISPQGNFEGRNILTATDSNRAHLLSSGLAEDALVKKISHIKERLYKARSARPKPIRDEKIITSWNGLMISAFAQAGLILGQQKYVDIATRAASFLEKNLTEQNTLYRSYKDGHKKHRAYLDDYAFYISSLIDLFEASQDRSWLQRAHILQEHLEQKFQDPVSGGYFMTSIDHEKLLVREKPNYDGAEPSGNSIAANNLLRLYNYLGEESLHNGAERALKSVGKVLFSNPTAMSEMLLAVDHVSDRAKEIVIVEPKEKPGSSKDLLEQLNKTFLPNRAIVVVGEGRELESLAKVIPFIRGKVPQDGLATAYVCEEGRCDLPTSDTKIFKSQIDKTETF